ncbi:MULTISPECIES: vWA domain-containing protein [Paracoccus]|jgi:mxaC protein|uniref:von Willebrand factor, type A n=1 Tax=Paracoccus denitrificans (strain Pd 1222) TaxID=318586 RepID=A1B6D9_PARDP|nr:MULTISPECIES: vWA domain-containing protein [Paracoccus]ABL71083.1 von Willebrand factor, type A [Paracoccus denitrificans PD1222]MBB4628318.1 mxaC protein [Paracoccus denitrificans]MCU7429373.1 VWA domain-containing protein [Paracoccus denitrificans]QAR27748.1 VWA domain-containing protein [Paracoccus denitrificans]RDD94438.1 VWA domain-containing protein [Paracoccus pantotrophus]
MIGFAWPPALFALPLLLLPLVIRWLRASAVPRLDLRAVEGRAVGPLLVALAMLAPAALILGLAQPYLRGGSTAYRGIGTNLVLLIDRSSSMDDTFAGRSPQGGDESKAAAARRILLDFIARRPDDRIGIAAFSTAPMLVLPMTESRTAIAAAVAALAEPGLSQTDVGRGLTLAMGMAHEASASDSRAVVLVSDGAAVIAPEVQTALRNLAARRQVNIYWLYLRTKGAKGIFEVPEPGQADTPHLRPERHLHIFLQSLGLPYHAFEADSPGAVEDAVTEIGRMESRPILTRRPVPRRDLAWACHLLASLCCAALAAARWLERRYAPRRPAPLLVPA